MSHNPDRFTGPESNKPLSLEEFKKKGGNFHMFFAPIGTMMGDIYRDTPAYKNCVTAHPEFETLAAKLQGYDFEEFDLDEEGHPMIKETDSKRDEMMCKLYDAYLIMRPYAKKSGDLFG